MHGSMKFLSLVFKCHSTHDSRLFFSRLETKMLAFTHQSLWRSWPASLVSGQEQTHQECISARANIHALDRSTFFNSWLLPFPLDMNEHRVPFPLSFNAIAMIAEAERDNRHRWNNLREKEECGKKYSKGAEEKIILALLRFLSRSLPLSLALYRCFSTSHCCLVVHCPFFFFSPSLFSLLSLSLSSDVVKNPDDRHYLLLLTSFHRRIEYFWYLNRLSSEYSHSLLYSLSFFISLSLRHDSFLLIFLTKTTEERWWHLGLFRFNYFFSSSRRHWFRLICERSRNGGLPHRVRRFSRHRSLVSSSITMIMHPMTVLDWNRNIKRMNSRSSNSLESCTIVWIWKSPPMSRPMSTMVPVFHRRLSNNSNNKPSKRNGIIMMKNRIRESNMMTVKPWPNERFSRAIRSPRILVNGNWHRNGMFPRNIFVQWSVSVSTSHQVNYEAYRPISRSNGWESTWSRTSSITLSQRSSSPRTCSKSIKSFDRHLTIHRPIWSLVSLTRSVYSSAK